MDGRIKEEYVLQYREGEKYNSHQTVQKKKLVTMSRINNIFPIHHSFVKVTLVIVN